MGEMQQRDDRQSLNSPSVINDNGISNRAEKLLSAESSSSGQAGLGTGAPPQINCNGGLVALQQKPVMLPTIPKISAANVAESMGSGDGEDEQLQMPEDRAGSLVLPNHENHYANPDHLRVLEKGGVLFSFTCRHVLSPYEAEMVDAIVNLSSFEDETRDNYVPHYDVQREGIQNVDSSSSSDSTSENSEHEGPSISFLLVRCSYLLPNVDLDAAASPELVASEDYHTACEPEGTVVWLDNTEPCTFRITKPIIPYLYSMTVQFKVSPITDKDILDKLSRHVGVPVHRGLLMERTKRTVPPKQDATLKAKTVLLYTEIEEGLILVTHATVILQAGLPEIVERVIDTCGSWGLNETYETAVRTRKYLRTITPSLPYMDAQMLTPSASLEKEAENEEQDGISDDDSFHSAASA